MARARRCQPVPNYNEVRGVDHGRRRFQGYFYSVFQLRRRGHWWFREGMLTEDLLDAVAWDDAMEFLLDYVEPLDQAIARGGYTGEMYPYFRKRLQDHFQARPRGPRAVTSPRPQGKPKGNVDADLVLRAMIEYPNYKKAVIVTSDGDFYCLVEYLKKQDKLERVLSAGRRKCSVLLKRAAADKIAFLEFSRQKLEYKKK